MIEIDEEVLEEYLDSGYEEVISEDGPFTLPTIE